VRRAPRPRGVRRPVALSGTPGTGKSAVARLLAPGVRSIEVADWALLQGLGRRVGRSVVVDLARLGPPPASYDLVVGHLAHLLPVHDVIVLRCRPAALARRLAGARRGTARDRRANVEAEALDVVLVEAVALGRRVWEIDTSRRSVGSVAREVAERLRRGGPARLGTVDWLRDPRLTAHLLDRPP